ncbi:MAG TPA: LamB/YcsF family protein, partial [Polyangiaceae bacterium]
EVFADRAYEANGHLASRHTAGSVIDDVDTVVARAVRLIRDRAVLTIDGRVLPVDADTLCIHGDTPGSDRLAAAVRSGLEAAGIAVRAIGSSE